MILTPIYLLSMLREVFYGDRNPLLKLEDLGLDAQPREIFIATCLLLPIVGIGLYPKLVTDSYDIKTIEVASKTRSAVPVIVRQQIDETSYGFSSLSSPVLAEVKSAPQLP